MQAAANTDDEGDVVFYKEFKPLVANEGTVRNSVLEAMMMERRESSHGY